MTSEDFLEHKAAKLTNFTPRELMFKYIRYLPWVIVSVAIMLLLAYVQLRYSTPVFSVSGKLLVKSNNPYAGSGDKFDDIFMMQQGNSRNMNDEMEIIRSRYMAQRVVASLGLETMYYNKGSIRSTVIYAPEMPIDFEIVSQTDRSKGF